MSVIGSHESSVQIKSTGGDGQGRATHMRFHGNPAKFLQGHNVFGSDDLRALVFDAYLKVCRILEITPSLSDLRAVKQGHYRLTRVDINYSYELASRSDVLNWLRSAEFKSKTRHGRPSFKGGTVYWGQRSKRWSLKAYCKAEEIEKHVLPADLLNTPIANWVDKMLRVELTLRGKELDELNQSQASNWALETPKTLHADHVRRIEMTGQIRLSDDKLNHLPGRLKSTYLHWIEGHDLRGILPKPTYYRHRKGLLAYGINIDFQETATPQSNVVPLIRVLEAVPASVPDWAFDLGLIHASARRA